MIEGGQGGEHGLAHKVGFDNFADGKFISIFPDTRNLPINFSSANSSFKKKVANSHESYWDRMND